MEKTLGKPGERISDTTKCTKFGNPDELPFITYYEIGRDYSGPHELPEGCNWVKEYRYKPFFRKIQKIKYLRVEPRESISLDDVDKSKVIRKVTIREESDFINLAEEFNLEPHESD